MSAQAAHVSDVLISSIPLQNFKPSFSNLRVCCHLGVSRFLAAKQAESPANRKISDLAGSTRHPSWNAFHDVSWLNALRNSVLITYNRKDNADWLCQARQIEREVHDRKELEYRLREFC